MQQDHEVPQPITLETVNKLIQDAMNVDRIKKPTFEVPLGLEENIGECFKKF